MVYLCMCTYTCVCAQLLSPVRLLCDPMDCTPPGSSVHGISQGRILERVAEPSSRDVPHSGIKPTSLLSPVLAVGFFTTSATWKSQSGFKQHECILQFWRSEV